MKNTSDLHCFYSEIEDVNGYIVFKPITYGRIIKPLLAICLDENNSVDKIGTMDASNPYCTKLLNDFYKY